jgi:hypothetical protein
VSEDSNQSPIQLGQAEVCSGPPPLAPRKGGGGGARGSRYDDVLDKLPTLEAGSQQYVKASLEAGTDKDKAIGAIRVALKRRFGKDSTKQFKVRALEGDAIGVFRVT